MSAPAATLAICYFHNRHEPLTKILEITNIIYLYWESMNSHHMGTKHQMPIMTVLQEHPLNSLVT